MKIELFKILEEANNEYENLIKAYKKSEINQNWQKCIKITKKIKTLTEETSKKTGLSAFTIALVLDRE